MKITDEEYNQIIQEMVNRLIDLAHLKGEKRIGNQFPKRVLETFMGERDELNINYSVTLIVNDLYQILGRIRREAKENV